TGHVSWGEEAFPEDYESDEEMHASADRMSKHPFRVVRELKHQGEPLPFTHKLAAAEPQMDVRDYEGATGNRAHITRTESGQLPTAAVAGLHGAEGERPGEHRNWQGPDWEDFKADIAEHGIQNPVFITVDHGKDPVISEGNHRRDAAVELGHTHIPAEVRYYGHAEQQGTVTGRAMHRTAAAEEEPEDEGEEGVLHPHEFGKLTFGDYPGRSIHQVSRELHMREPRYMAALKDDVKRHGVREPVEIAHHGEDAWEVTGGHHRLAAAHELGKSVPYVRTEEAGDYNPPDSYHQENTRWRDLRRERFPEEYHAYMRRGEADDPFRHEAQATKTQSEAAYRP